MKKIFFCTLCMMSMAAFAGQGDTLQWIQKDQGFFKVYYTSGDSSFLPQLTSYLGSAQAAVLNFFGNHPFKNRVDVYLFPERNSLDQQWSKAWGIPGFRSECWMVASGVARRLDILSPACWPKEACDHNSRDTEEVRKIILHELVHVYHGQHNLVPTFDGLDDLGWFIEGIATTVSGQLDPARIDRVRQEIQKGAVPAKLSDFWTGKEKYGRSGLFVQFLIEKYGSEKIFELLRYKDLRSILAALKTDEETLINLWKDRMLG